MKKELLTEIKHFNELINYDPKVGLINEVYGDRDITGWPAVGQKTSTDYCGCFFF